MHKQAHYDQSFNLELTIRQAEFLSNFKNILQTELSDIVYSKHEHSLVSATVHL